jgi:hypothetical protein
MYGDNSAVSSFSRQPGLEDCKVFRNQAREKMNDQSGQVLALFHNDLPQGFGTLQ